MASMPSLVNSLSFCASRLFLRSSGWFQTPIFGLKLSFSLESQRIFTADDPVLDRELYE